MDIDYPTMIKTIIVIITIIFIIIIIRLSIPLDLPTSTVNLQSAINQFETGDIIAVAYSSIRGQLIKIFTGSIWSHVGLIYRSTNNLYVLECAYYDDNECGVLKTPLSKWLNWNKKKKISWVKRIGPKIDNQAIENIYLKINKSQIDSSLISWLKAVIKQKYKSPFKSHYYCSELVALFLQELGIIKKIYLPSGYPPKEIIFGHLPFTTDNYFTTPYLLINNK